MMKQRKGLTTHIKSELKKTSSWAIVDIATEKHQTPSNGLKLYVRAVIESVARRAIKEETIAINRD